MPDNSMLDKTNEITAARVLLQDVTPIKKDCGRLCGQACCKEDANQNNGMLLFPGEEKYYLNQDFCEITPLGKYYKLICSGHCPRENRPLACRIFPLAIIINDQAQPEVVLDIRAWPLCPLMPHGMAGLSIGFIQKVKEAAALLVQSEANIAFLQDITKEIAQYTQLRKSLGL